MRKIRNPYNRGSNLCFGCSSKNPIGLKLQFFEDGDEILSFWSPGDHYQGFTNVLHGGIQSTLLDEIASWTVFIKAETAGVTSSLNIRYLKPVLLSHGEIIMRSKVSGQSGNLLRLKTQLFNGRKELCTEGDIVYFIFPEAVAKKKFFYPGIEAFYDTKDRV